MIYTEYADVEYLKTPMESINGRNDNSRGDLQKMKLGKRLKLRRRKRNSRRREADLSIYRTERDTMRDAKGKPK